MTGQPPSTIGAPMGAQTPSRKVWQSPLVTGCKIVDDRFQEVARSLVYIQTQLGLRGNDLLLKIIEEGVRALVVMAEIEEDDEDDQYI